jgi:magnesium chelatase subunit I
VLRAARALAALKGEEVVSQSHIRQVAPMALGHRLRRNPLDETGSGVRIERAMAELFDA